MKLLPEPKQAMNQNKNTNGFKSIALCCEQSNVMKEAHVLELAQLRFWNRSELELHTQKDLEGAFLVRVVSSFDQMDCPDTELFFKQGYVLEIGEEAIIRYGEKAGLINALTSLKQLIGKRGEYFVLPQCKIVDWPEIERRAVAPTFSWYAGYGRLGFDLQLFGYDQWVEFLNMCVDQKINQMNMVMYGYWPFEFEEYPETVFQDIKVDIWNKESSRWLKIHYSHPNIEEHFLQRLIELAHKLEVKIFAYVGLNSYNGAYSIKHPDKRMVAPKDGGFMNDFDSLCLSDEENIAYIKASMKKIAQLGFDGFTLEESEEGFWFCECKKCKQRWHVISESAGEAKHRANMWLLREIYDVVRGVNPNCVIGIRAFRQPPLEKDPEFLRACVQGMPDDVVLFWAPGLYVPETEFPKWVAAFGKERIWGRDTESNSITSTMGRLYRIFESNVLRYSDESNVQVIERDIEMHITSAEKGVRGINGFMFEWYGYFMHLWAHGNYAWGSKMEKERFYSLACEIAFGTELGKKVLFVLQSILTIHESQMPLYTTPFPFQKNKVTVEDLPEIMKAKVRHPGLLELIHSIQHEVEHNPDLKVYQTHFAKIENAERRNFIIYDMMAAALGYENAETPEEKEKYLDEILYYNEKDFDLVKDMFFDINPVGETGVKSCMYPYHEIKRIIHNLRHPDMQDNSVICSGIEALGWLWL